jgi:DHA1 family bicyclomycin/chloramphenicol resistance-like MFS transporter
MNASVAGKSFIGLMAMLMSLSALSIDAMLPALSQIGHSFSVTDPNKTQFVVSALFLGMAMGLLFYGPLSDSFGRKKAIYLGIGIFLIGDLISLFSVNFTMMIVGRLLQGLGVASCRVVTLAMIRDRFEGQEMAKVMSMILMIFILVPALAPTLGQAVLLFAGWHAIFILILTLGIIGVTWLYFGQAETLHPNNKRPFSISIILEGIKETWNHPISRGYTLASGMVFGAFIGYLSSAQQILQIQYGLGKLFALYFGVLALTIGASSFVNSRLLHHFKMEKISLFSLRLITLISLSFYIFIELRHQQPSLHLFMLFMICIFFLCRYPFR